MKASNPKFSPQTLKFLISGHKSKSATWLDRHRAEYEELVLAPFVHLAKTLKKEIGPLAPDYHFPQKGIARIKRSARSVEERGGGLYKDWMTYSASRPRVSRFEHNPNLFFLINTEDKKDPVLLAGGLYMPSSRQTRAIREKIASDASEFEKLFASKDFKKIFRGGFSDEQKATRPPRGFDPNHPKIEWLKLQAFFVWKPYSKKEFSSPGFAKLVARDCRQILRLNRLLEQAVGIAGRPTLSAVVPTSRPSQGGGLLDRLEDVAPLKRELDFDDEPQARES